MKKIIITIALAVLSISFGFSDKGLILQGAYGTFSCLGIQAGRIYIFTGEKFHVFDLKDGKPLKTFGRIGQGPGEYGDYFAFPFFSPEGIVINNMGKCVQYTLDGAYLSSIRPDGYAIKLLPFGARHVGQFENLDPEAKERQTVIRIIDDKLAPVREVYRQKKESSRLDKNGTIHITFPSALVDIVTDDGKLFVGDPAENIILSIFDGQGDLIRKITRETTKIKVPEEEKKEYLKEAGDRTIAPGVTFRTDVKVEADYPSFRFFKVEKGLIYVFTYRLNGDKREVLVLDEYGKDIASVWLTKESAMSSCVYNKKFYYVVYDEEIDELVLHSEEIFN